MLNGKEADPPWSIHGWRVQKNRKLLVGFFEFVAL